MFSSSRNWCATYAMQNYFVDNLVFWRESYFFARDLCKLWYIICALWSTCIFIEFWLNISLDKHCYIYMACFVLLMHDLCMCPFKILYSVSYVYTLLQDDHILVSKATLPHSVSFFCSSGTQNRSCACNCNIEWSTLHVKHVDRRMPIDAVWT